MVVFLLNDDYHAGYDIGKYVAQNHYKDIVFLGVGGYDEAVGYVRKKGVFDGLKKYGVDYIKTVETDFTFDKKRSSQKFIKKIYSYSYNLCNR